MYTSVIAPSVISADSPRFLGFIPAAPTKASLLFDMLVSCASIQGISWLEASGAITAEQCAEGDRPRSRASCDGGRVFRVRWLGGQPLVARRGARDGQSTGRAAAGGGRIGRPFVDREHAAIAGDGRAGGRYSGPPAHSRVRPRCRAGERIRHRRGGVHLGDDERRDHRRPCRRGRDRG